MCRLLPRIVCYQISDKVRNKSIYFIEHKIAVQVTDQIFVLTEQYEEIINDMCQI